MNKYLIYDYIEKTLFVDFLTKREKNFLKTRKTGKKFPKQEKFFHKVPQIKNKEAKK